MNIEYFLLSQSNPDRFNSELNEAIKKGWSIHGNVTVASSKSEYSETTLFCILLQRQIKPKENGEKRTNN